MKKLFITILLLVITVMGKSQTAKDLFNPSNVKISWLGVDFSHVKLIGNFSQFFSAGEKSSVQLRDKYFSEWNNLILAEPEKFDIKGMLRKGDIMYDIDMLMKINLTAGIEDMETYNTPIYTKKDIVGFISPYNTAAKEGIGILLLAEDLNKNAQEAHFHFIAINMKTNELLIHERLRGKPTGIGLRNYWAGSIYDIIKEIKHSRYNIWREQFK